MRWTESTQMTSSQMRVRLIEEINLWEQHQTQIAKEHALTLIYKLAADFGIDEHRNKEGEINKL